MKLLLPHQDVDVVFWGDGDDNPDLFNHGKAINLCAERARGDVFLIMDADTTHGPILEGDRIVAALYMTTHDRVWRLPSTYIQLTEGATEATLDYGTLPSPLVEAETEWRGENVSWSGLVIVPREAFELVGGADERYVGWGADDVALGLALDTLYGKHERYQGAAVHLWHPRGTQEKGLHRHGDAQRDLTLRYVAANGIPPAMRALVEGKRL